MPIVLASQSPRRIELLGRIGLSDISVIRSGADETAPHDLPPGEAARIIALRKAEAVKDYAGSGDIIIAADTIVALDDMRLGKPEDEPDAVRMLGILSGRRHTVFTGVAVLRGDLTLNRFEETAVYFRPLDLREIEAYVKTGEPMDKAGAYGIQEIGATFVRRIEGDFYNVMGLPLCLLAGMLKEAGLDVLETRP